MFLRQEISVEYKKKKLISVQLRKFIYTSETQIRNYDIYDLTTTMGNHANKYSDTGIEAHSSQTPDCI